MANKLHGGQLNCDTSFLITRYHYARARARALNALCVSHRRPFIYSFLAKLDVPSNISSFDRTSPLADHHRPGRGIYAVSERTFVLRSAAISHIEKLVKFGVALRACRTLIQIQTKEYYISYICALSRRRIEKRSCVRSLNMGYGFFFLRTYIRLSAYSASSTEKLRVIQYSAHASDISQEESASVRIAFCAQLPQFFSSRTTRNNVNIRA